LDFFRGEGLSTNDAGSFRHSLLGGGVRGGGEEGFLTVLFRKDFQARGSSKGVTERKRRRACVGGGGCSRRVKGSLLELVPHYKIREKGSRKGILGYKVKYVG